MQQLLEHLRKIEEGKQTNARILRKFQSKKSRNDAPPVNDIDPNEIYSILQGRRRKKPSKEVVVSLAISDTPPNELPYPVEALTHRRNKLHEAMTQILRPPETAPVLPPAPSPPKVTYSLDNKLKQHLKLQHEQQIHEIRRASAQVETTMAEAQDLIPLSFLLERNMAALCQSKAGAIIKSAFHALLLQFYADAWEHWQQFIQCSRAAERQAAALVICRVFRGHRTRKACEQLRLQLGQLEKAKSDAIMRSVKTRAKCALAIQMVFRQFKMRQRQQEALRRHTAATRIQHLAVFNRQRRLALAKMLLDARLIHAALQVQRVWRGSRGRRVAKRVRTHRRQQKLFHTLSDPKLAIAYRFETNGAAFRIQRQVRRWLQRRRGRAMRQAIQASRAESKARLLLLKVVRRFKRRKRERELEASHAVRTKAARIIQRYIAQWVQHRKWKLLRVARRKQERLARMALKAKRLKPQNMVVANLSIRGASKTWRTISSRLRKPKANRKEDAVVTIQRAWRYAKKRHQVYLKALYVKLDVAASRRAALQRHVTRIQKVWRGRRERRKCRILWLDKAIRNSLQKWKARRLRRRNLAAMKIQTKYRAWCTRRITEVAQRVLHRQHASASRIQRLARHILSVEMVQRRRDAWRLQQEILEFCSVSLQRCLRKNMDFLVLQSLEGTIEDVLTYREWLTNNLYNPKDAASFPIFQILFLDYSGIKRDLWSTQSIKEFKALRLDRSKFVKLFREAFASSERLMEITSEADRVLAKLKAHPSQSRSSLAYTDFVFCMKEMAKLQIKSKKLSDDERLLQLFWRHFATSKWSQKYKAPDQMKQYALTWMEYNAQRIQRLARRDQYRQRGLILLNLKRLELQQMKIHKAAQSIQNAWRGRSSRQYMRKLMQKVFRKYIDAATGLPYWTNPQTGYSTWKKPSLLGKQDVDHNPIPLADEVTEYEVKCSNCNIEPIHETCFQCQDNYCKICFQTLHAKGKMATHQHFAIPTCTSCLYQIASRLCNECKEPYCDNCMAYLHSKGTLVGHSATALMPICIDCNGKRATRVHCQTCNKNICKSCWQFHPPEYCQPLPFISFPVEAERARFETLKTNEILAEEKRIQDAKDLEALKIKMALRIQRGWRRKVSCKTGIMHLLDLHKQKQDLWEKIRRDRLTEKNLVYQVKYLFGKADVLETDSSIQRILRGLNIYTRHKIESRARALNIPLEEYLHLGVLLPGVASINEGSNQIETSEDLRGWLVPAQAIRIQNHIVYADTVESVGETFIRLSEPFAHPGIVRSQFYGVEFSHEFPVRLIPPKAKHQVKLREMAEKPAVTKTLLSLGATFNRVAHSFDEDSFLGKALTRTAQRIQKKLHQQQFERSKRSQEVAALSMNRSEQDKRVHSLRREMSMKFDRGESIKIQQQPTQSTAATDLGTPDPPYSPQTKTKLSPPGEVQQRLNTPPFEGKTTTAKLEPNLNTTKPAEVLAPSTNSSSDTMLALNVSENDDVKDITTTNGTKLSHMEQVEADTSYSALISSLEDPSSYNVAVHQQQHTPDESTLMADSSLSNYNMAYNNAIGTTSAAYTDQGYEHANTYESYNQPNYDSYCDYNSDYTYIYNAGEDAFPSYPEDSSAYNINFDGDYQYPSDDPVPSYGDSVGDSSAIDQEWQEAYDPSSGQMYYYNTRTGESVWQ
ncbi:hypothetical protein AeRB84_021627 [Aphanomyces euteiches]|nr:hypothetical protein AeRB84_021627 [Aphanomyces euteiches]